MSDANLGSTQYFRVVQEQPMEVKEIIKGVFAAMQEKGYNPINQFVGYIMSGDRPISPAIREPAA